MTNRGAAPAPLYSVASAPHDSPPSQPTWRGLPVHPTLALWFDQLLSCSSVLIAGSSGSNIDVLLTIGRTGNEALRPQITFK